MVTKVETKIDISEIFLSIQGEGLYTGEPTVFIRFKGCDLGCTYCDSMYTWKKSKDIDKVGRTAESLIEELLKYDKIGHRGPNWVCITGGEPLQQYSGFCELVDKVKKLYKIEVETSGLVPLPTDRIFTDVDSWVVDLKLPSSNVTLPPIVEDYKRLRYKDQIKLVIGTDEDFEVALKTLKAYPTEATILVSPMFDGVGRVGTKLMQDCVDFCITNGYRLSLQIHKYIWGMRRGV